ncbi:TRAP transporter small permease [Curvivirga aplysinae]|uniref:TRAP transporter small permease n=1 Tax=Curvivirga aplysinae TaxID=2529852 RepID=UPI0012BD1179|nr:TRAP transporter small permease [Curvivirga aplysinae]MTI11490.1 TRAP transporter small permease [Curvivirga aplysinae]
MSHSTSPQNQSFMDRFEENMIALLLGLMTLVTFANVVARYVFESNLLWALETTVFIFAWMVLLGASYGVKKTTHIGVDVLLNMVSPGVRKFLSICAVLACIAFALLLLKGSWDYWYPFVTKRAWLETDDVPMFWFLRFLEDLVNEGEVYEKMPRFIPYFVLPLSMALLSIRFIIAGLEIIKGTRDGVIASHEAEELLDEVHTYGQHDDDLIKKNDAEENK